MNKLRDFIHNRNNPHRKNAQNRIDSLLQNEKGYPKNDGYLINAGNNKEQIQKAKKDNKERYLDAVNKFLVLVNEFEAEVNELVRISEELDNYLAQERTIDLDDENDPGTILYTKLQDHYNRNIFTRIGSLYNPIYAHVGKTLSGNKEAQKEYFEYNLALIDRDAAIVLDMQFDKAQRLQSRMFVGRDLLTNLTQQLKEAEQHLVDMKNADGPKLENLKTTMEYYLKYKDDPAWHIVGDDWDKAIADLKKELEKAEERIVEAEERIDRIKSERAEVTLLTKHYPRKIVEHNEKLANGNRTRFDTLQSSTEISQEQYLECAEQYMQASKEYKDISDALSYAKEELEQYIAKGKSIDLSENTEYIDEGRHLFANVKNLSAQEQSMRPKLDFFVEELYQQDENPEFQHDKVRAGHFLYQLSQHSPEKHSQLENAVRENNAIESLHSKTTVDYYSELINKQNHYLEKQDKYRKFAELEGEVVTQVEIDFAKNIVGYLSRNESGMGDIPDEYSDVASAFQVLQNNFGKDVSAENLVKGLKKFVSNVKTLEGGDIHTFSRAHRAFFMQVEHQQQQKDAMQVEPGILLQQPALTDAVKHKFVDVFNKFASENNEDGAANITVDALQETEQSTMLSTVRTKSGAESITQLHAKVDGNGMLQECRMSQYSSDAWKLVLKSAVLSASDPTGIKIVGDFPSEAAKAEAQASLDEVLTLYQEGRLEMPDIEEITPNSPTMD